MLYTISDIYDKEVGFVLEQIDRVVAAFIIAGMFITVAYIIVSLFMPRYQLTCGIR